ncbi:NAD(P)/FAD-dependent oxidoreductase [uncultured Fluviicola sp.]|uniref:NAD(P)/FAD-dependent oxidoreductase n=1 Tax=uncultured Fluviicola sp. TaxID=463303 RepID=UPI0025F9201D|nr:NAD(P)/FAD-dependent oxidoreductase [uncultured Fluviicola sp.]
MTNFSRRRFIKQTGIVSTAFFLPLRFNPFFKEKEMMNKKHVEVIIVGGSYSGLAAAMALGRALRKVLVIDSKKPCNRQTPYSHNFLTQDGKTPTEISELAKQQVSSYNTIEFFDGIVTKASKADNFFEVQTASGNVVYANKLIFATGIKDVMPDIKGFSECWGISVLHCPYCHGYEVKSEITGVLGNGEYGFEFSKLISNWTKELTLFTNGKSTLTPEQTKILERHSIRIEEKEVQELEHVHGKLQSIIFNDGTKQSLQAVYSRLPFNQHCTLPEELGCEITVEGYLKADALQRTTIDGVFACGDNVNRMRTVASAVAMGTTAGMTVNKELVEEKFIIERR